MDSYAYNKYPNLPNFSYNCINKIMDSNEMIWKLLKYDDPEAWLKPDLTQEEKGALIYSGQPDESIFKVFMDEGQINSWTKEFSVLRIWPYSIFPKNRTVGTVTMVFDVYSHYRINHLSNYTTRVDVMAQIILEVFNGWDMMGGLGNLFFDVMGNKENREYPSGQIPYKGKRITMSTQVG